VLASLASGCVQSAERGHPVWQVIEVIVGGLITILTAVAVEAFRKPKLSLSIEERPLDVTYNDPRPAQAARRLRLKLLINPCRRGRGGCSGRSVAVPWENLLPSSGCRRPRTYHVSHDRTRVEITHQVLPAGRRPGQTFHLILGLGQANRRVDPLRETAGWKLKQVISCFRA
jgi:hypothetical protein